MLTITDESMYLDWRRVSYHYNQIEYENQALR